MISRHILSLLAAAALGGCATHYTRVEVDFPAQESLSDVQRVTIRGLAEESAESLGLHQDSEQWGQPVDSRFESQCTSLVLRFEQGSPTATFVLVDECVAWCRSKSVEQAELELVDASTKAFPEAAISASSNLDPFPFGP